jgi:hypothetical protein
MSEETAREIVEREIGRPDEKRKTPERRNYRTGRGRRRDNAPKNRPGDPDKGDAPATASSSAGFDVQRKLNRG